MIAQLVLYALGQQSMSGGVGMVIVPGYGQFAFVIAEICVRAVEPGNTRGFVGPTNGPQSRRVQVLR